MNPYRGLPSHQFWEQGVSLAPPGGLDPVIKAPKIAAGDRIVTLGSCFAQHLARNMAGLGLNYFVAEAAPADMSEAEAWAKNYGVFSARFGNIYTVPQAVQLFDRAFGRFVPIDDVWECRGGFVDAFRPRIEPKPHESEGAVRASALAHLAHVRDMFHQADWLIFTLGLTEGWRSTRDGAVYPLAPGVAGGSYDPSRYEFVNFSADSNRIYLGELIDRIANINPQCRIILTVSPVALIATYEPRHVLVSTVASKAALRVAADETERAYPQVTYFPSYEIITSPSSEGRYYADDLRDVTDLGVKHVMRVFKRHFVAEEVKPERLVPNGIDSKRASGTVVCDEETIAEATGFAD